MAQHKAPTDVTVAPISEKSALEAFAAKYWVHFTLVFLALISFVVFRHFREQSRVEARDNSWAKIAQQTTPNIYTQIPTAEPTVLATLAEELQDTAAGPSARLLEAHAYLENDDYAQALASLERLRNEHPDFGPVKDTYVFEEGGAPTTLIDYLRTATDRRKQWFDSHPEWTANPDAPADSPEVVIKTDQGDITVRLYAAEAPLHVENFLKHAREGFYVDTKFHRVTGQSGGMAMIQGGDPNTKVGNPPTWGQGGPGYNVDFERNSLRHFRGVLSAAKKGNDRDSSGSQFFITTAPAHHLDGKHVVYGQVVAGIEVAEKIIESATFQQDAPDRPENPAVILSVEVKE